VGATTHPIELASHPKPMELPASNSAALLAPIAPKKRRLNTLRKLNKVNAIKKKKVSRRS